MIHPSLHYKITLEATFKEGCSSDFAGYLARENVAFDSLYIYKPWAHFRTCGATFLAELFLFLAVHFNSKKLLVRAIHALQDSFSHGSIFPWQSRRLPEIDKPEEESAVYGRIEEETHSVVRFFLRSVKTIS